MDHLTPDDTQNHIEDWFEVASGDISKLQPLKKLFTHLENHKHDFRNALPLSRRLSQSKGTFLLQQDAVTAAKAL